MEIVSFEVHVLNDSRKQYESIESAIDYAAKHVYLPWEKSKQIIADLKLGKTVSWAYGFRAVTILPKGIN